MGKLMSIAALPSASHAKPSGPWVTSTATHRAATPGMAHQRRIRIPASNRSEEHTSELQSLTHLACRLLLEKNTDGHSRGVRAYRRVHSRGSPRRRWPL